MFYILLFLLLCLMILAFLLLKRDIFSPGFIVCVMFFLSTICCMYNSKYWGTQLEVGTCFVIIGGCLTFVVISCVVQKATEARYGTYNAKQCCELEILNIGKGKVGLIILLNIFLILMQIRFVKYVTGFSSVSLSTWSLKMEYYRNVVSYDTSNLHISVPSYITIPAKLSSVFAYIFLYICINNFLVSNKKAKNINISYVLPVLCYIFYNLVGATRGSILTIFIAGMVIFHLLYHKKYGWGKRYGFKVLLKIVLLVVIVAIVFVLLRDVVGRRYSSTAQDPLYYICCYAGGSIHLLNDFIKNPTVSSNIWGEETFYSIIRFLGSHFDIDEWVYVSHLEYRVSNGLNVGNIYTAFRKYIYDFGYFGVVWCTAIVASIYNFLYYHIKYKKKKRSHIDVSILFFGYIAYGYFYMSIQEQPLSTILCLTTIIMPLLYKCAEYWLFKVRFKFFSKTSIKTTA